MEYKKDPVTSLSDSLLISKVDVKEELHCPETTSTEIKLGSENILVSEPVCETEAGSVESNDVSCNDALIIEPKVEIKEEPGWVEGSSEIKSQLNSYDDLNPLEQITTEDATCITGTHEHLLSAPRRFCSEVFFHDRSKASSSVFVTDVEETDGPEKPHASDLHLNIFGHHYTEWQKYLQSLKSNKFTQSIKSSSSKLHMKNDSMVDKKPHKCEICNRSFIFLSHLKRHKYTHEGKKPYSCDICEKHFTRDSCLRKHKLLHEGKRPYKCDICNRTFAQVSYLKAHKLTHDSKRPHKCVICDRSFTRMAELKRHNKLVHEKKHFTSGNIESVMKASLKSPT